MATFSVNILGCGSAAPTGVHNTSCQVVEHRGRLMMIDCGEGAQVMIRRMHLKFSRLTDIFISHLHGDHFFGLPGLLSTLDLSDCGGTVTVHAFKAGLDVLRKTMAIFCPDPGYTIVYHEIENTEAVILDTPGLTVRTVRLKHRVPCVGFVFEEKPKARHINGEMTKFYQVPVSQMQYIRQGADYVTPEGVVVPNERLTRPADPSYSYAYLSDTKYNPEMVDKVRGVSLMYHEATYGDDGAAKAGPRGHSTAREAAEIARAAGAGQLMLGHYSKTTIGREHELLDQAREVFPNTILANEGLKVDIC